MYEWVMLLPYSACIPVCAYLLFRPKLNIFFKFLLATAVASVLSEVLGSIGIVYFRNNLYVYQIYMMTNVLLVSLMWNKLITYTKKEKEFSKYFGLFIFTVMLILVPIFWVSEELIHISIVLGLFLNFVLALQYFYHLLLNPTKNSLIKDPYVLTASAFIFLGLASVVIMVALEFVEQESRRTLFLLRQVFNCFYYLIISYIFYIISKKPELK